MIVNINREQRIGIKLKVKSLKRFIIAVLHPRSKQLCSHTDVIHLDWLVEHKSAKGQCTVKHENHPVPTHFDQFELAVLTSCATLLSWWYRSSISDFQFLAVRYIFCLCLFQVNKEWNTKSLWKLQPTFKKPLPGVESPRVQFTVI